MLKMKSELTFIPQQKYIRLHTIERRPGKMIQFANGFYTLTNEGKIRFNVLRFGQVSGWMIGIKCAFSFDMTPGADTMVVQQGRIETTKKEVLEAMVEEWV
jgi:hypothetical protein